VHDLETTPQKKTHPTLVNISFVEEKKIQRKELLEEKKIPKKEVKVVKRIEPKRILQEVKKEIKSPKIVQNIEKKIIKKQIKNTKQEERASTEQVIDTAKVMQVIKKLEEQESTRNVDVVQERRNIQEYINYINETINKNKFYPKMAKKMGLEGSCSLSLKILHTGEVLIVDLKEKSSFTVLNEAALQIIKKIGSFKAFPDLLQKEFIILNVPIKYTLKG
jgi:protein TonB